MKIRLFILFIFLLQKVVAQQNYVHYTVKDGLPQMQCMKLFQDSKGYIWIATKGGISKYDGVEFKNFTIDDGLPENQIIEIKETKNGNIWVLTNSGLSFFKDNKFTHFPTKENYFFKSEHLIIDNEQQIWLIEGYRPKKLIKFTNGNYKEVFSVNNREEKQLKSISYDTKNNNLFLILTDPNSSYLYSINNGKINILPNQKLYTEINHIEKFIIKKESSFKSKKNESILYKFHKKDTLKIFQTEKAITKLKYINDSTYVFTEGKFNANMPLHYVINGKLQNNPKHFDQINDILQDSENNMWIASERGLYKLTAFNNFSEKDNMPSYVWAIQEDKNNNIWFATYSNKRNNLYYLENNRIKKYTKNFKNGFYMGVLKTKNNNLLFPYANGIIKYDGTLFSEYSMPESVASLSIYQDPETLKLYFGTYNGLVIKDTLGNFKIDNSFVRGKNDVIQKIIKNRKGELWFVTANTYGILNRDKPLVHRNKLIKGAKSIYCDFNDNLWIGTNNGLFFYDYKNLFKINHPELKTMIGSVENIDSTHFVFGGLRGIGILDLVKFYEIHHKNKTDFTFNNSTKFIDYYTQSHGFLGEEIGQNGIFKDSQNQIWIPTNNNVVMFNPKDLKKNVKEPYTYITNLQTSNDNINWSKVNDSVTSLNHRQSNIHINFIGISLTSPDMVSYKYRLKGFNDYWSNETKKREVTFTNLSPKNYTFELLASNGNGIWNKKPIVRSFTIVPVFWQTIWFKILLFITILFAIFKLVTFIYKRNRKKSEINERLNNLQLKAIQSQLYPHLLFNAVSATGSVIYKENKEKAYDFVVKLSQFMRSALEDSKKLYKSLQEELNFVESYLQLQKIRFSERFNYEINIGKEVNLLMQIPQMIIQTYVENAVKHGLEPLKEGGLLKINIVKIENGIQFIIEDNGIGIEKAKGLSLKGTGSGIKIMNEIYEIHNEKKENMINYELVDLYKIGGKGTKSVIHIKLNNV